MMMMMIVCLCVCLLTISWWSSRRQRVSVVSGRGCRRRLKPGDAACLSARHSVDVVLLGLVSQEGVARCLGWSHVGGGVAGQWREEVLKGRQEGCCVVRTWWAASEQRCFMLQKRASSLLLSLHQATAGSGGVTPPGGGLNSFVGPSATTATTSTPNSAAAQGGGGSSFGCNVCFKTFLSGWELRRHLHAHADARPFHCPYCSHRSNFKHNLKSHIRSIHPGKPFFAFTVPTTAPSEAGS
ncbi:Zinc finger protein 710 [Chionoecetes opilio]|uniref:Zinc finger protein 710 n=1 Tax=Chionoecetes opilio TaxID=41210 RepID=A0A8J4YH69_CHIOP|nr:Zinc finger protein 710 [Chionoecetes opilio]